MKTDEQIFVTGHAEANSNINMSLNIFCGGFGLVIDSK